MGMPCLKLRVMIVNLVIHSKIEWPTHITFSLKFEKLLGLTLLENPRFLSILSLVKWGKKTWTSRQYFCMVAFWMFDGPFVCWSLENLGMSFSRASQGDWEKIAKKPNETRLTLLVFRWNFNRHWNPIWLCPSLVMVTCRFLPLVPWFCYWSWNSRIRPAPLHKGRRGRPTVAW